MAYSALGNDDTGYWETWVTGSFREWRYVTVNGGTVVQSSPPPRGTEAREIPNPYAHKELAMRGVFLVLIVDPENEAILHREEIVAINGDAAKMSVGLRASLDPKKVNEYDYVVVQYGQVRDPEEIQSKRLTSAMLRMAERETPRRLKAAKADDDDDA